MKPKQMLMDAHPPFISDEIITNILKRLRVKSLIRFQCVSKHWKTLIETPSFVQDHLHHQNLNLLIQHTPINCPAYFSLLDHKMKFHEVDSTPIWMNSKIEVVDSCNGLLCLSDCNTYPPSILLWNPATREVRQITSAFHTDWYFGFGFCPILNDYKIARFTLVTDKIYGVDVYSLSTGSSKIIHSEVLKNAHVFGHAVTINGIMYWYASIDYITCTSGEVIISLDLANEVLTVAPSPVSSSGSDVRLAVYADKLAIISYDHSTRSRYSCIYLWGIEEGDASSSGSRWSLRWKYCFESDFFMMYEYISIWRNQIVCIDHHMRGLIGKNEAKMENGKPKCGLCLFNIVTNERKQFAMPELREGNGSCAHVYNYVESHNYVESLVQIGNMKH